MPKDTVGAEQMKRAQNSVFGNCKYMGSDQAEELWSLNPFACIW